MKYKEHNKNSINTGWGKVASWYDTLLEGKQDTYQKEVILPGILKLLNLQKRESVLDLACGQGFFSRELFQRGASVTGVDVAPELIQIARKRSDKKIRFEVGSAAKLSFLKPKSFDAVILVLAIQNIDPINGVFKEARRVLKDGGKFVLVINHPAFRIPRQSGWGWDEKRKLQYRRVDSYLSEIKIPIQMHPSARKSFSEITWSFHRPLQNYFKALDNAGFLVSGLEEWISHRASEPGPRARAENRARQEIPLFLALKALVK
ncbi:MAG: class I SAM-dependent methyltransferase [Patescibacteria group bacterium]